MTPHDVVDQMRAAGLDDPPLPLEFGTARPVRFGPKKRCWYRLHEQRTRDGAYVVVGSFGDWRLGLTQRVEVDWKGLAAEERERLTAQRKAQDEADRAERARESDRAAMSAVELWREGAKDGASAYLQRKGVAGESCRYLPDGSILVPLLRYDMPREQALRAVQRIRPDGSKRFTRGFAKPGCCLRLGHAAVKEPILMAEGYATALTLRDAVRQRLAVVVALDAGNLLPVAELLRALYPTSPLLLCADDDWRTKGNPGRTKAFEVARAVDRVQVTYPIFRPAMRGPKDTDFNDLQAREGLDMVRHQLRMVLPLLSYALQDATPDHEAARAA